ncbi:hypothetical protein D9M72_366850 [compost metagenome]
MVGLGLRVELRLELGELLREFVRHVHRLGVVVAEVVQGPVVILRIPAHELGEPLHPGFAWAEYRRYPAVLVDAAAAEHLEVLRRFARCGSGVGKGVAHADAVQRVLRYAIDRFRWRDAEDVVDGRGDVVDVMELLADLAIRLDAYRPGNRQWRACSAEVAGHQLGTGEGAGAGPGPGRVVHAFQLGAAQCLQAAVLGIQHLELLFLGEGDAVLCEQFVDGPLHAFGGGSVVAEHVEDQGVVAFALAFQLVEYLAGLGIGMLHEAGVDLHQARLVALLLGAEAVPGGEFRGAGGKPGILGNEPERLLAGEGFFAVAIPAGVELALVLVRPLCADLVRSVHGARRPVEEEGFVRCVGLLVLQPVHGLLGEVLAEVVARITGRLDRRGVAVQARLVLRGFAGQEAVEMLEPVASGPGVEGAGRTGVAGRGVVPFAEGRGAVAVLLEYLGHGCRTLGDFAGIPVPVGG